MKGDNTEHSNILLLKKSADYLPFKSKTHAELNMTIEDTHHPTLLSTKNSINKQGTRK